MSISFPCVCGQPLEARDDQAGSPVRCPACGQEVQVPGAISAAPPAADTVTLQERPAGGEDLSERVRPQEERAGAPPRKRSRVRDDEDGEGEDFGDRPGQPERTSGMAIAALVLGLLSPCASVFTGIPAIVCGILGLRDIGRSRGRVGGTGLAIAGIVLGVVGMLALGPILIGLLVPAVQKVREAASRATSANNLRQMGIAMHNYNSVNNNRIPARAAINGKDGQPLLSWRVALLPYLEQDNLYRQFHLDEPWDSPHNKALIPVLPRVFVHPSADPSVAAQGMTHYRAVTGPMSAFEPCNGVPPGIPQSIPDGTSNTIMLAEATDPVIWTKPDELAFEPGGPLPRLGLSPGRPFQVLMWDGSVRSVSPSVSRATLENALMANDGMPLGPDW